jgi:hypothetical protein
MNDILSTEKITAEFNIYLEPWVKEIFNYLQKNKFRGRLSATWDMGRIIRIEETRIHVCESPGKYAFRTSRAGTTAKALNRLPVL